MSDYKGIKDFISDFKEPFDKNAVSLKKAKERVRERGDKATSEAVKEEQQVVLAEWKQAQDRGIRLHKQIQDRKIASKKCVVEGWVKHDAKGSTSDNFTNHLNNNTNYIEKKITSEKYKLIGYADDVVVENNFITIEDTKTTKTIYKTSAIKLRTGMTLPPTYFNHPIGKLQACNYNEIALQTSLYMYLLWTENKKLKPGKMFIRHIKTNITDKITEEVLIELPYLRTEVRAMLKYRLQNL